VPGGNYIVDNLDMSAYIKIKPLGTVVLTPSTTDTPVLTISPTNAGAAFASDFESQQYLQGDLIDGSQGTFFIKGITKKGSFAGTGLVLGSDKSLGDKNCLGRYSLKGISIAYFDTLVQIKTKDNYIGSFKNCHFESGNYGVKFGSDSGNVSVNSGENFGFYQTIIASCLTSGVKINSPVDANFYGCSFDFNNSAIECNSSLISVNVFGGHIEGNIMIVLSDYASDGYYYSQPRVNISGSVVLDGNLDPVFKGKFILSISDLSYTVQQNKTGSSGTLCDYSVNILGDSNIYYTNGYSSAVTRKNNRLYNSSLSSSDDGITYSLGNDKATKSFITSGLPAVSDFPNAIHIKNDPAATTKDTPTNIQLTKFNANPGETYSLGCFIYMSPNSGIELGPFSLVCYDYQGKEITEVTDEIDTSSYSTNNWEWVYSHQLIIPERTSYVIPKIYLIGPMEIWIGQLYCGKV
ncbi:hypothetical protein, partial [Lactiplantibacillus plantarum]|uniref:hypothetical protein n=1 Tax=Lactiplantibacillus plantarum TaxID=1590 RepID=UPI001F3A97DC